VNVRRPPVRGFICPTFVGASYSRPSVNHSTVFNRSLVSAVDDGHRSVTSSAQSMNQLMFSISSSSSSVAG